MYYKRFLRHRGRTAFALVLLIFLASLTDFHSHIRESFFQ